MLLPFLHEPRLKPLPRMRTRYWTILSWLQWPSISGCWLQHSGASLQSSPLGTIQRVAGVHWTVQLLGRNCWRHSGP